MKIQIENSIDSGYIVGHTEDIVDSFNVIVDTILDAKNEEDLRANMLRFEDSLYFAYGFGSNHMWVKQRYLYTAEPRKERLLFVKL